jgi:hypothetical protein
VAVGSPDSSSGGGNEAPELGTSSAGAWRGV